jgi:hypothetical protein
MATQSSVDPAPSELTANTHWEWRVEFATPWHPSLDLALEAIDIPAKSFAGWPKCWTIFFTSEQRRELRAGSARDALSPPSKEELTCVPENLVIDEKPLQKTRLETPPSGHLDLAAALGSAFDGRTAFAYASLDIEAPTQITIYAGADYWMQWWVDGVPVYDTLKGGNRSSVTGVAHSFSVDLNEGPHVIVARVISGSGGWAFASEATTPTGKQTAKPFGLEARRVFDVPNPNAFQELTFDGGDHLGVHLNGHPLPVPFAEMSYSTIPGIPAALLKEGRNELTRQWSAEEIAPLLSILPLHHFAGAACGTLPRVHGALQGWPENSVAIQTGPILGWASESSFSLTCRTNLRCEMTLEVDGKCHNSPRGAFHKFEVTGLPADGRFAYQLTSKSKALASGTARTLGNGPWRIAMLGDVYPFDDTWQRIAEKVLSENPDLVIFSGDMVLDGRVDAEWDSGFFQPAQELLSTIPFYAVLGNHEYQSPIFGKIFSNPGDPHWHQQIGPVLFVGIDGSRDWSPTNESYPWLDGILGSSAAAFKFVISHYPPYSSGGHGRIREDGPPHEHEVRQARDHLVPLLNKHQVNAIVSGHDHFYERSELPGGLTGIVSAGAGSRLYKKTTNPKQNPYSKVFASEYHYCILEVSDSRAIMTSISLKCNILDSKEWMRLLPQK